MTFSNVIGSKNIFSFRFAINLRLYIYIEMNTYVYICLWTYDYISIAFLIFSSASINWIPGICVVSACMCPVQYGSVSEDKKFRILVAFRYFCSQCRSCFSMRAIVPVGGIYCLHRCSNFYQFASWNLVYDTYVLKFHSYLHIYTIVRNTYRYRIQVVDISQTYYPYMFIRGDCIYTDSCEGTNTHTYR